MLPPLLPVALALISSAAIGYEIILIRLFSVVEWYHFAYMIISLALLGYGVSGTFLVLVRPRLQGRFMAAFALDATLFGLTAPACFAAAQAIPFNALEVVWDPGQSLGLLGRYLVLAFPFFCAANCVGLALMCFKPHQGRVYAADLIGAALGALLSLGLLFVLEYPDCLKAVGLLGCLAAAVSVMAGRRRGPGSLALALGALVAAAGVALLPSKLLAPRPSPYKGLSQALQVVGAELVGEYSGPLGLLSVVHSPTVPIRHAPGMSLHQTLDLPAQLGLFTDGDALSAINRYDGRRESLGYLEGLAQGLPFMLLAPAPKVLVLGAGTGADLLLAVYHDAASVDAVEVNGDLIDLMRRRYRGFTGGLFELPKLHVHLDEARSFIERSQRRFDLIQMGPLGSFAAASVGVRSLNEGYVYTVEALARYVSRLESDGILSLTRWLRVPPRDGLKLVATAIEALRRLGVEDPGKRLVLIRSWNTTTLLIKNGEFNEEDGQTIVEFCERWAFDSAYYPGMPRSQANRYNVLDSPYFYDGALALLGERGERYLGDYKFDIRPASDDRPFFGHFLRWRVVPELLSLRARGGVALVDQGYLVVVATLLQAALAAALLILAPLLVLRSRSGPLPGVTAPSPWRVVVYFAALGLAFLFIEIAFIQRFVLFVGNPLYAVAAVLASFLFFAGLGSAASERLRQSRSRYSAVTVAVACISIIALGYVFALPALFGRLIAWPGALRLAVGVGLIAPLGFFMGMPFPLGLALLTDREPDLLPWAWGINGCASVLSAVLATILAIHLGFSGVVALAVVLYWLAAAALRPARPSALQASPQRL
ncbi:MAG: SAM-dependent methyltransferase [Candidatus Binatia bacterium]